MKLDIIRIKELMARRFWDTKELIEASKLGSASIYRAFQDGSGTVRTVTRIAAALEVPVEEIIVKED